jgi:hypothetical protein
VIVCLDWNQHGLVCHDSLLTRRQAAARANRFYSFLTEMWWKIDGLPERLGALDVGSIISILI